MGWVEEMAGLGVVSMRLHILEVDMPTMRAYIPSVEECLATFLDQMRFKEHLGSFFDISSDMRRMLSGKDNHTTCAWAGCDPYSTQSVYGVGPDGSLHSLHNCGRANGDSGVDWQKADSFGFERTVPLPYPAGTRWLCGLQVLPDVPGQLSRHHDRPRLAEPQRVPCVERRMAA